MPLSGPGRGSPGRAKGGRQPRTPLYPASFTGPPTVPSTRCLPGSPVRAAQQVPTPSPEDTGEPAPISPSGSPTRSSSWQLLPRLLSADLVVVLEKLGFFSWGSPVPTSRVPTTQATTAGGLLSQALLCPPNLASPAGAGRASLGEDRGGQHQTPPKSGAGL